jgi:hypothetical protein
MSSQGISEKRLKTEFRSCLGNTSRRLWAELPTQSGRNVFFKFRNWERKSSLDPIHHAGRINTDENWTAQRLNQQFSHTTVLFLFPLEPFSSTLHTKTEQKLQNLLRAPLFVGCNVLEKSKVVFELHANKNKIQTVSSRYGGGGGCLETAPKTFTRLRNV